MSNGYSRNGAVNIANHVPTSGITYERMYMASIGFKNMCDGIIAAIPTVIEAVASKISEMVACLGDCVHDVAQAMSSALSVLEEGEE